MTRHVKHRAERGTHPVRWAAVLCVVFAVAGGAPVTERPAATGSTRQPSFRVVDLSVGTETAASEPAAPAASPESPRIRPAAPRSLAVPALSVTAPVVGVAVDGTGVLTPPDDPEVLGWWSQGAPVGSRHGSTLITGHTVHSGGGALDHLEDVEPGAIVRVRTDPGIVDYVVTSVRVLSKGALAGEAERLFSQSGEHRLVLITCEDWNGKAYESNVVVIAAPA